MGQGFSAAWINRVISNISIINTPLKPKAARPGSLAYRRGACDIGKRRHARGAVFRRVAFATEGYENRGGGVHYRSEPT